MYPWYSNMQEKHRFTAKDAYLGNHMTLMQLVIYEKFPFRFQIP